MTHLFIAGGTEYDVNDMRLGVCVEGCLVGVPCVVIRLEGDGGDDHRRQFVDRSFTEAPELWTRTSAEQIARAAREMAGRSVHWVMLTGVEPARQKLKALVDALHARGLNVTVETGGEEEGIIGADADWTVIVNPNYQALPSALAEAHEVRFTIVDREQVTHMALFYQEYSRMLGTKRPDSHVERCVQPGGTNGALDLCLELAKVSGYRLSGVCLAGVTP